MGRIKEAEIKLEHLLQHETKRYSLFRFGLILLVLILYFVYIVVRYGIEEGVLITLLTWSFFVLCTPLADAGFLLDFPLRLITKGRMIYSEVWVWIIAILLNAYAFSFSPAVYDSFFLLRIFKQIILTPFPYWSIVVLSAIGTFLSIYFADELLDVVYHKERVKYHKHMIWHHLVVFIFLILVIIFLYSALAARIGLSIGVLLGYF